MIKTILFDVDGVLIQSEGELFSVRYSRDFNVPVEEINPFIKNEAQLCKVGKADLKEELTKYIKPWKWNRSVDELVDYWYGIERSVNKQLLTEINKLRRSEIKCYIASDNEKYRAEMILMELEADKNFDGAFFSYQLGVTKAEKEFFGDILLELDIANPAEVALVDDKQKYLDIAEQLRIKGLLYKNNEAFTKEVAPLIK